MLKTILIVLVLLLLALVVVGFVAPNGERPEEFAGLPVLGCADELPEILQREVVDEVFFILSRRQLAEFEEAFLLQLALALRRH